MIIKTEFLYFKSETSLLKAICLFGKTLSNDVALITSKLLFLNSKKFSFLYEIFLFSKDAIFKEILFKSYPVTL